MEALLSWVLVVVLAFWLIGQVARWLAPWLLRRLARNVAKHYGADTSGGERQAAFDTSAKGREATLRVRLRPGETLSQRLATVAQDCDPLDDTP